MLEQTGSERRGAAHAVTLGEVLGRCRGPASSTETPGEIVVADGDGLTVIGRAVMGELAGRVARPRYDAASRCLTYRGRQVKQLLRPASNQEMLMEALESRGWPDRIDDPIPVTIVMTEEEKRARLRDTVNSLNDRREWRGLGFVIRNGGVAWEAGEDSWTPGRPP